MLEVSSGITMFSVALSLATYVWVVVLIAFRGEGHQPRYLNLASILLLLWLMFQSALALNRWYMDRASSWPHWLFAVLFPITLMVLQSTLSRAKRWGESIRSTGLIWIHVLRLPIAWLMVWLASEHQLPIRWTYFGWNFDIVFGITAPIIGMMWQRGYRAKWLRIWHIAGIASLLWIWLGGLLSAAGAWQIWDINAPNYAFVHFPFVWLPSAVFPLLVWAHVLSLQKKH
jgi:hypothetical protein